MQTTDDVKSCPACGGLDIALATDRSGVRTFYCAECEYDWDEKAGTSTAPDAPEQPQR
jgi:formate dehydrogenase maturation protein FdhE